MSRLVATHLRIGRGDPKIQVEMLDWGDAP